MKDNKETLDNFEKTAHNMLDSLQLFLPSIDKLKDLAGVELDEDSKKLLMSFPKGVKD